MDRTLLTELEQFLYHEANLLDDRRFEEWLGLLTDDILYWVPNYDEQTPRGESGVIVYERMSGLRARVARSLHDQNPIQMPPPRTRHFITNVMVASDGDGTASVTANLLLYVSRSGRLMHHPGKSEHKLRRIDGSWRISEKRIYLIANDQPLSPLPLL